MKKTIVILFATIFAFCVSCTLNLADAPTFEPASGTVGTSSSLSISINSSVKRAKIRYTIDGTDPTYKSALYDEPIVISRNTVLKAAAFMSKRMVSAIGTATYTVKAATPTAEMSTKPIATGTYVSGTKVTLSCSSQGTFIYYTTNGETPTVSSDEYVEPITLTKSTILKVIAIGPMHSDSDVLTVTYNVKTAKPMASVTSGMYGSSQTVTLSCATTGATIYYTLDGTTPTTASTPYSSAISLTNSIIPAIKTLKMIAVAADCIDSAVSTYSYTLYTTGPAGGLVFYDCDADNDETNCGAGPDGLISSICGWRYLEAAPEDITKGLTSAFVFGHYRTSDDGVNLYVNGTTTYEVGTSDPIDGKSTGTAVGTGKTNTTKLNNRMGAAAYTVYAGSDTTADYAAKLCADYEVGGFDDWFLPSKDELNLMYNNLRKNNLGEFGSGYWSSSENGGSYDGSPYYAWFQHFNNGTNDGCQDIYHYCTFTGRVRAIRAFK